MTDETGNRCQVFNRRKQPVELHCGSNVLILPSMGMIELDSDHIETPQIKYLAGKRHIKIRPVQTVETEAAKPEEKIKSKASLKNKVKKAFQKKQAPGNKQQQQQQQHYKGDE